MEYLKTVCKIGQRNLCCRYIIAGINGIRCAKLTSLKPVLDARSEAKTMVAQADNCAGVEENTELSELKINSHE